MSIMNDKIEQRKEAVAKARAIHETSVTEKRDLNENEEQQYQGFMNESIELAKEIKALAREDEIRDNTNIGFSKRDFRTEIGGEKDEKELELRGRFEKFLRNPVNSTEEREYRDLQQDNATQAGYLVAPQTFMAEIIQNLKKDTFFRSIARVLPPLKKSESLGVPTLTDHAASFVWGGEISAPTKDTALKVGKREFRPHPGSGEIIVSKNLIRNSAIPMDAFIRDEISYDIATNTETAYFTGNGVGRPLGVFVASADGIPAAQDVSTNNLPTSITFDGLIEAKYKIKPRYWTGNSWIFHADAVKQIAKLKNGEGDYIWKESVRVGEPDRILGMPVNMSEFCPNTFTSGLYVGILGNFKEGYWIVDSLEMEIQALFELYARTNQVDYLYRIETDGAPVKSECFARVKLG
jgi:HK97 family phage major capsid protein